MPEEDPDLLAGDNLGRLRGRKLYFSMSDRFRLTELLKNANYQNNLLAQKCRELEEERNEARRLFCEDRFNNGNHYRSVDGDLVICASPKEIADDLGWDCFKENANA